MSDLTYLSIEKAGRGLRQGNFSAVELTRAHLDRIARIDPHLNAFLYVASEEALAAAERADHQLARSDDHSALLGIPYVAKDMIDVAGTPTTCHSRLTSREPAAVDADVIARLTTAGAVFLGKTALHEFATGGPAFDLPFPPARNPWNRQCHPGGSSSGGAVAVVSGMAMAAIGTDTAGSLRNPATCCGIVGLKPTYDLVSRHGVFPLSFSLDHVGPMTRSVQDCALLLDIIADNTENSYSTSLNDGIRGLRIGVLDRFHADENPDNEIVSAFSLALEVLTRSGAELVPVTPPSLAEFRACGRIIQQAESYTIHRRWLSERPTEYCELSRQKLAAGALLGAADFIAAQQARRDLIRRYREATKGLDATISVSSFTLPCRIDDADAIAATYERHARMPFNVTGDPAIAVPVDRSPQGLPLGVQLSAGPYMERTLLRVAHSLQTALNMPGKPPAPFAVEDRYSVIERQKEEN
jgi:aspartyl-tRNA(Asn)/glutamyl-tRNA(Gln) amidotransferase subunit A